MSASVSPRSRKPVRASQVVVDFEDDPSELAQLIETLKETNVHLGTIAGVGTSTLSFVRKWIPWAVAALAVAYPAMGRLIASLPSLPS